MNISKSLNHIKSKLYINYTHTCRENVFFGTVDAGVFNGVFYKNLFIHVVNSLGTFSIWRLYL